MLVRSQRRRDMGTDRANISVSFAIQLAFPVRAPTGVLRYRRNICRLPLAPCCWLNGASDAQIGGAMVAKGFGVGDSLPQRCSQYVAECVVAKLYQLGDGRSGRHR